MKYYMLIILFLINMRGWEQYEIFIWKTRSSHGSAFWDKQWNGYVKKMEVKMRGEESVERKDEEEMLRRLLEPMYKRFIGVQICILNMRRLAPEWVEDVAAWKEYSAPPWEQPLSPSRYSLSFHFYLFLTLWCPLLTKKRRGRRKETVQGPRV